ncbi:YbcC family protein [Marinobacter adhaerens]|uniref:YbcC family protein n=1 Tax=Marinobacter adhaerens TaxID=1033846 RepID=UPI003F72B6EC
MSDVSAPLPELQWLSDDWRKPVKQACDLIAPVWPLDQWIAVNPFWGLRHLPAPRVDQVLNERAGFSMLLPTEFYREAWEGGRIREDDLRASIAERGDERNTAWYLDWLGRKGAITAPLRGSILDTFAVANAHEEAGVLTETVCEQVSRVCGAFFDQRQSRWSVSGNQANGGLFGFWLESVRQDLALDFTTGLKGSRAFFKTVSDDRVQAVQEALSRIGAHGDELEALCHSLLLRVNGWASWCRGEDWRAGLEGRSSDRCEDILAIMLVWESAGVAFVSTAQKAEWQTQRARASRRGDYDDRSRLWVWQRAFEIGYQRTLWQALDFAPVKQALPDSGRGIPAAQAVFCIDVRSEVMRRHLEEAYPDVQTLGFAGFFGMPIDHQQHGPLAPARRLPGLLPASFRLIDTKGSLREDLAVNRSLDQREIARESVRKAKYTSLSTFTLVETTGLAWAWKLVKDTLKKGHETCPDQSVEGRLVHSHGGDPLSDAERVALAANMLRGMSLTRGFAPLLVLVGHGSHTDNNPNQAGLDCGACGGQSGGVNARLAASLVNDPQVRAGLADEGIRIPDFTWAVAAEHCTATDKVTIADRHLIPDSHMQHLADLEAGFETAGIRARKERATPLKLNGLDDDNLKQSMETRTRDWSEVRPEWGLANNAAIIFAKRSKTRGCNLSGRVFLHDYDPTLDEDGGLLEALLAAPMIVANWINLQYFASVTVPEVYGSGNKLLHSVVGGNVGVVEGNNARLRIGLPLQSVHDGTHWRHEPVRLTVLIDAPEDRIESVLRRQPDVAALVENQWVSLHRMSGQGVARYDNGNWVAVA